VTGQSSLGDDAAAPGVPGDEGTEARVDVSVIVVAYGPEELLDRCLTALRSSEEVTLDLHVVDNGCTNPDLARIVASVGGRLHRAPTNLGFAGGANLGASHATGTHLCFVNSDAIVDHATLGHLVRRARVPAVGLVCGSIRHLADPTLLNSTGNPMHLLGYVRAQRSRPLHAGDGPPSVTVATASGAAVMLRREVWDELGGFAEEFFLYHEDVDLSLAAWQHGYVVECATEAAVLHDYAFTGTPDKVYLAERNRLIVVLTRYPGWLLRRLTPLLVLTELGALVVGGMAGLRRAKLRGWWWLVRHRAWLRRRRSRVQASARTPDAFVPLLDPRFQHDAIDDLGVGARVLDQLVPRYARLVMDGRVSER
jgi:GT2 family glycosyltransferase